MYRTYVRSKLPMKSTVKKDRPATAKHGEATSWSGPVTTAVKIIQTCFRSTGFVKELAPKDPGSPQLMGVSILLSAQLYKYISLFFRFFL